MDVEDHYQDEDWAPSNSELSVDWLKQICSNVFEKYAFGPDTTYKCDTIDDYTNEV